MLAKYLVNNIKVSTFAPAIERDAAIKDNESKNFRRNLEVIGKSHYLCATFRKSESEEVL